MIKILRYILFTFGFCMLLSACKKETAVEAVEFAFLNLDNRTNYTGNDLYMTYNSQALNGISASFSNIKVPVGKGKLAITDSTGKSLLDTTYTFEANKTINWVLFQPTNDVTPVILENNGSTEPQPDAEHIKVKFANFAPNAFNRPFDVVFYWEDENFNFIEGGRIDNIPQNFPDEFTELVFKERTYWITFMLVDHETQQPLLDDIYLGYGSVEEKRIITFYLTEPTEYGSPVTGTPHKVNIKALFEN
ncbi:hypothetical protein [Arcticibacter eurypsychrophilus]|uniref:hypothetical protein n=1 Tax=Arcticibacter eurypsychrophilus TaxID=1434752 RepID=UPI00084DD326|nr:hypothetical protein [Arcticibacter eurypsychrophilus]